MKVTIQRKGHAKETLTDPTFEQCFNPDGKMQCTFYGVTHANDISLKVTAPPQENARIVHHADGDLAKIEYGFADAAGLFGQRLPHVLTESDGRPAALYKNASTAGVSCATTANQFFNLRASSVVPSASGIQTTLVCDGH